jgi:hypothetical protein
MHDEQSLKEDGEVIEDNKKRMAEMMTRSKEMVHQECHRHVSCRSGRTIEDRDNPCPFMEEVPNVDSSILVRCLGRLALDQPE